MAYYEEDYDYDIFGSDDETIALTKRGKPRKRKPKEPRIYFTQDTEDAIIEYLATEDTIKRNQIYNDRIKYGFYKLAENIIHTFKFYYTDTDTIEELKHEVITFLLEKLHLYNPTKGKAFSYFTIVARNYLILNNNSNYKRYKDTDVLSTLPENWDKENNWKEEIVNDEYKVFNRRMLEYWDIHLESYFSKKRDIQIADAVLELFRRADHIENFNKKITKKSKKVIYNLQTL